MIKGVAFFSVTGSEYFPISCTCVRWIKNTVNNLQVEKAS